MSAPYGDDWLGLFDGALPVAESFLWAHRSDCGAVVLFSGVVRDHAEGRSGVQSLTYEAYTEQVNGRLEAIAAEARQRWDGLGRLALLHRIGTLSVGETSVVVVASAAHRAEAFEAARYCIDTLKAAVPIWKEEVWEDGTGWGTGASGIDEVGALPTAGG